MKGWGVWFLNGVLVKSVDQGWGFRSCVTPNIEEKKELLIESSHFGRPKTNFRRFQIKSEKQKKKKKKNVLTLFLFHNFFYFHFQFSTFPLSIFLLNFHPFSLFSLPLFSRYVSKNFPVRSLWGAFCPLPLPPPVTLLCVTYAQPIPLPVNQCNFLTKWSIFMN